MEETTKAEEARIMELRRYEAEKMADYNKSSGDLTGYDCPLCHNKGNRMEYHDGYEVFVPCVCMEKRRTRWRLEKSGLLDMADRYRMDTFLTKTPHQQAMKAMAEEFIAAGQGWLFMGGQMGSGKSHICAAICNELMEQGKSVRYMLWTDAVTRLKSVKMNESVYAREMAEWKEAEVLYIDDFFKTVRGNLPTDADMQTAFELVNARYNDSRRITIFSGENTLPDIIDMDEALGSRIYQRCGKFVLSIGKDPKKNYRLYPNG